MAVAVVTGVSSGIGRATALDLARRGHHVVAAGRSRSRTMPVVDQAVAAGGSAEYLELDLASLASVHQASARLAGTGRTIDLLVNNAGVGGFRGQTQDGFEVHFGVNHLGHFAFTLGLLDSLRAGFQRRQSRRDVGRRAIRRAL